MRPVALISVVMGCIFVTSCGSSTSSPDKTENDSLTIEVDSPVVNDYWVTNKIHHANLYLYFPEVDGSTEDIERDGVLSPFICDSMTKQLDSARVSDLQNRLIHSFEVSSFGADCYFPHHGVVYFNENDEVIGSITMCTSCGQLRGEGSDIPVEYYSALIDSLGLPNGNPMDPQKNDFHPYRSAVRKHLEATGFDFDDEYE